MKIKPLYVYLGALVIIILAIVLVDSNNDTTSSSPQVSQESAMPQDDIHKELGSAPGSGNVSSEFKQKMANLKSGYESNPKDTVNSKEYARLLAAAHDPEEALEVYKSILSIAPDRYDIRLELATVYYSLQRFNDAKEEIETVYKKDSNSPDVLYNLGAVEASLGNNERAKELWQKVIDEHPTSEAAKIASTSIQSLQ